MTRWLPSMEYLEATDPGPPDTPSEGVSDRSLCTTDNRQSLQRELSVVWGGCRGPGSSSYRNRCSSEKRDYARKLRSNPTPAEAALWARLRRRRLHGLRFGRQRIVLGWIVDFLCPELRLVVEVDGPVHLERRVEDARRAAAMAAHGFTTLRLSNETVLERPSEALAAIAEVAREVQARG